jgi:hypothetical protein
MMAARLQRKPGSEGCIQERAGVRHGLGVIALKCKIPLHQMRWETNFILFQQMIYMEARHRACL